MNVEAKECTDHGSDSEDDEGMKDDHGSWGGGLHMDSHRVR